MVNIYFSITNPLNWSWNKLSNWTSKKRGKRWPGENCPLWREFWIQTWHVRIVAATGGSLIKSPRFSGLSNNTNVTFYCNCSNAPFNDPIQLFARQHSSESWYRPPGGSVPPTLKPTNLECLFTPKNPST